jgi:Family of unknown function (DUF6527)
MKRDFDIAHEFVELVPRDLKERTLYVSIEFATATHKCFCGCGSEVVTPISPVGWQVTFDGETVSLSPSVGSWSLECQSHYWIRRDRVEWAEAMSPEEIAEVRERDDADRLRHYRPEGLPLGAAPPICVEPEAPPPHESFRARLARPFG